MGTHVLTRGCRRPHRTSASGCCFIACPTRIDSDGYDRNCYTFMVLLVLTPSRSEQASSGYDAKAYFRVASGIARRLAIAERESRYISQGGAGDAPIWGLLREVHEQLVTGGRCSTYIDREAGLSMHLLLERPLAIHPAADKGLPLAAVPQWALSDGEAAMRLARIAASDHTFGRVIAAINGGPARSIEDIGRHARVHIDLVRRAVGDLM